MNRSLITKLSSVHFCHSKKSVNNLKKENILKNVYLVGNTIVDSVKYILEKVNNQKQLKK